MHEPVEEIGRQLGRPRGTAIWRPARGRCTGELKSTRLALELAPWRDSPWQTYMLALLLRSCWCCPLPNPLLFVPFFFSTNRCQCVGPALLLSSLPSPLLPYPHNRETCAGLFMLFLWHFHPRSEAHSRRVGTGGDWSRCDWRAEIDAVGAQVSALTWQSMARHKSCVHRRAKRQTTRA